MTQQELPQCRECGALLISLFDDFEFCFDCSRYELRAAGGFVHPGMQMSVKGYRPALPNERQFQLEK